MSFKYKATQRNSQPGKKNGIMKWYASAAERDEVTVDELAHMVSQRNSLSTADCRGVIIAISEIIAELLAQGKIVRLGELCSMLVALSSDGVDKEEDVHAGLIRDAHLNVRPADAIQAALRNLDYKKG